jgi:hypothetical protein
MKNFFLLTIIILSCLSCKNDSRIDVECIGNNKHSFKDLTFHIGDIGTPEEAYVIKNSDSWTYSAIAVFEKLNDLDFRLKTFYFNQDTFRTERKLSKNEWIQVKSLIDSSNFWCLNHEWDAVVTDGFEINIGGLRNNRTHHVAIYQNIDRDSFWRSCQDKLRKTSFNLMNMADLIVPQKPKIIYHKLDNKKIGIEVYSPNHNFSKLFEVYLDDKKIEIKQGVAELIIIESDLDKFQLKVKEVLINDVELSFEATLNQYLLDVNKNNK